MPESPRWPMPLLAIALFVTLTVSFEPGCASAHESAASAANSSQTSGGQGTTPEKAVGHIWIALGGEIYFNRHKVTVEQLKADLHALKLANGVIYYTRDQAALDPTPAQFESFKQIIDINDTERLPIKLLPEDPEGQPTAEPSPMSSSKSR